MLPCLENPPISQWDRYKCMKPQKAQRAPGHRYYLAIMSVVSDEAAEDTSFPMSTSYKYLYLR